MEMIRSTWLTDDWVGFYCYWKDWTGKRWVLKYLFSWCDCCPEWLFKEGEFES